MACQDRPSDAQATRSDGLGPITSLSPDPPISSSCIYNHPCHHHLDDGDDLAHLEGGRVERGLGLVVAARGGEAAVQQELDHLNSEHL